MLTLQLVEKHSQLKQKSDMLVRSIRSTQEKGTMVDGDLKGQPVSMAVQVEPFDLPDKQKSKVVDSGV